MKRREVLRLAPEALRIASSGAGFSEWPFRVVDEGVFWLRQDANRSVESIRLSARVDVVARTRDIDGHNHARLLKWTDQDGREHTWPMPMELLASDTAAIRAQLLSDGLPYVTTNIRHRERFAEYLQTAPVSKRFECVDRIGWHSGSYVLPEQTLGPQRDAILYQSPHTVENHWKCKGTLQQWREHIGALCLENSRLLFAASCSFAAPLLAIIGMEAGGIHILGPSSTGKTTMLRVAASVCGEPGFMQSWNATANALEAIAHDHNDAPLILDELAQLNPNDANQIVYLLANGLGKGRMSRNISTRKRLSWCVVLLSTGEISVSEHAVTTGKRPKSGVEVRMLNLPGDAGASLGVFEDLHDYPTPSALADALRELTATYFGTPFVQFVDRIAQNRAEWERRLPVLHREQLKKLGADQSSLSGEVKRAADRFALIAAAGELATSLGVTGWKEGQATKAAFKCYRDWLGNRGTTGSSDMQNAVEQVRAFIELHGASRFQHIKGGVSEYEASIRDRAGFKRLNEQAGAFEFLIFKSTFKDEVCRGFRYREIANELLKRGYLARQGESLMHKTSVPGIGPDWFFCVRSSILGSGHGDDETADE